MSAAAETKAKMDGTTVSYSPVGAIYEQNAMRPERDWPKDNQSKNPLEEFIYYKDEPYANLKKGGWIHMVALMRDSEEQMAFVLEARSGAHYTLYVEGSEVSFDNNRMLISCFAQPSATCLRIQRRQPGNGLRSDSSCHTCAVITGLIAADFDAEAREHRIHECVYG